MEKWVGSAVEVFGSCNKLAAAGQRGNVWKARARVHPLLFCLSVPLKVTPVSLTVGLLSKKHSNRCYFSQQNVVQTPGAESASCLCSPPHTPHLTSRENFPQRVSWLHSSQTSISWHSESVTVTQGWGWRGWAWLFSYPMRLLLQFKQPLLPPRPYWDHVTNTSRHCGKWHRQFVLWKRSACCWKEKLSSSQETGVSWGWYSNLWIQQKSISCPVVCLFLLSPDFFPKNEYFSLWWSDITAHLGIVKSCPLHNLVSRYFLGICIL